MTTKSSTQSRQARRNFLKGAAYASAVSIGGLSSLASASCRHNIKAASKTASITLFNQSDKTVALNASQPVRIEKLNGWLVVKINKASEKSILEINTTEIITLSAGQQFTFPVESEFTPMLKENDDVITITNEFSALDNTVPVTTYDTQFA